MGKLEEIHVASLYLCKKLYELSEWKDTEKYWYQDWLMQDSWRVSSLGQADESTIPAYDLGYLVRKLPSFFFVYRGKSGDKWYMGELTGSPMIPTARVFDDMESVTPEDIAAMMCIDLFQEGVLTNE